MNTKQVARQRGRLPGEIAFDRCFLPLAALSLLHIGQIVFGIITRRPGQYAPLAGEPLAAEMPPPDWQAWLWFALGLLLAVLWFRAMGTLVRAWRDPSSRVLRFSASVLLIPFAVVTGRLLLTPFQ